MTNSLYYKVRNYLSFNQEFILSNDKIDLYNLELNFILIIILIKKIFNFDHNISNEIYKILGGKVMFEPFENTITTHISLGKPQYWPATKIKIAKTHVEVNYNNTIVKFLCSDLVKITKNDIYLKNNDEIKLKLSKKKLNNQELELIKSW